MLLAWETIYFKACIHRPIRNGGENSLLVKTFATIYPSLPNFPMTFSHPPLLPPSLAPVPLVGYFLLCFLLLYASTSSPAFNPSPGMASATGTEGAAKDQHDTLPPQIISQNIPPSVYWYLNYHG